jgi:large subunit ribosomal protein L29
VRRNSNGPQSGEVPGDERKRAGTAAAEQVFRLRFQISAGQAEGLKKMREARKDLARVKTLLRAIELRKA